MSEENLKLGCLDSGMTLHEYAKQVLKLERPMDPIAAHYKYLEMADYVKSNKFTMLLNRERNDYTIFNNMNPTLTKEDVAQLLKECVKPRGTLLLVDKLEDDSCEIWVRNDITKENFYYRLFNCEGFIEAI